MLAVLRQKNFARLWSGGAISMLGDWLLFIALPFAIYNMTGSALATGAMFIVQSLPTLLFGAIGGVFADRWDRRRTMIVADLLRAALLLLLLLAVRSAEMLWALYLVVFLEASAAQFFNPAKNALLPRLVDEQQLMPANALNWMSIELTRLVGAPLGGLLVALWGLESVILIDSASYLLSALLIALVAAPPAEGALVAAAPGNKPSPLAQIWRDLVAGLRLVVSERWLAGLFLAMGALMIGQGITNALLVPFINQVLHGDEQIFGWIVTAQGVGGLAGGLLIGRIGKLLSPTWIMSLSAWLLGAIVLVIVNIPWLPLVLGLVALVGLPVVAFIVTESTLLQTGVADEYRGRVFGAYGTTQALTVLVGMGLASVLGDRVGVVPLLDLVGGLYLLAGLIILLMVGRRSAPAEGAELGSEAVP